MPRQRGGLPQAQAARCVWLALFNPTVSKRQIYELVPGHFIRAQTDALCIGPPGVGETRLAQAIGDEAIKPGFVVGYRSIFDLLRGVRAADAVQHHDRVLHPWFKPGLTILDSASAHP